jgi:hypothetical protein
MCLVLISRHVIVFVEVRDVDWKGWPRASFWVREHMSGMTTTCTVRRRAIFADCPGNHLPGRSEAATHESLALRITEKAVVFPDMAPWRHVFAGCPRA